MKNKMMKNITECGIKTVAILDDDISIKYTYDFLKRYVDPDCLNSLSDPYSPSRVELFELYGNKDLEISSVEEIISSFNDHDIRESLPVYYREEIIDVVEDHKLVLKQKIDVISESLLSLGVNKENIFYFDSLKSIKSTNLMPDLLIIDLFLEEGKPELSLDYLKGMLESNDCSTQYILMSYATDLLINYFRQLHIKNRVCSAQLKVIAKPNSKDSSEKIKWEQALVQISLERELIHFQRRMQVKWSELIENASNRFIQKIWSLDNFGINKLRLTAIADDMSLADYFISAMYKALLAEVENEGGAIEEMSLLESKLKVIDDRKMLKPSGEIYNSYSELNSFIADLTSHRFKNIKQVNVNLENEDDEYRLFLNNLCYGSILQIDGRKGYLLHLTQPCDYIHIKKSQAADNNLFLIPGYKHGQFSLHFGGNKKHLSSFVYLNEDISNIEWNLRMVETQSMKQLFDNRKKIAVVGKLRNDEAQAISHLFGSSISRVATSRLPWFTNIDCVHIFKSNEVSYNYFDNKSNVQTLKDIVQITSNSDAMLKYQFHIDKRLCDKSSRFVVTADTSSISRIVNSLSLSGISYSSHFEFQDIFVLGDDNMVTNQEDNITFIFLSDFKNIFSAKDTILTDRFREKKNHHFFVLINK